MITKTDRYIAKVIKTRRKARKLTQEDLAQIAGYNSRISIVAIENCTQTISPFHLYKMIVALGLTPNEVFPPIGKVKIVVKHISHYAKPIK